MKTYKEFITEVKKPKPKGRPRGAPHIENVRFWDLSKQELQYIVKDAKAAMKAHPGNPKNTSGPGNYSDQVNDAATVMAWRKKKGINEGWGAAKQKREQEAMKKEREEHRSKLPKDKHSEYDSLIKKGFRGSAAYKKVTEEAYQVGEDLKQARKNVGADKCWDGYKAKGTKNKGGKEVPNCVKESEGRLQSAGVKGYNKPKRTPGHPKKSHIVVAKDGSKVKTIRFGEQGAETAGDPKKGESKRMKMKRKSFKARHSKNIAKGKMSAAYWADKVKW